MEVSIVQQKANSQEDSSSSSDSDEQTPTLAPTPRSKGKGQRRWRPTRPTRVVASVPLGERSPMILATTRWQRSHLSARPRRPPKGANGRSPSKSSSWTEFRKLGSFLMTPVEGASSRGWAVFSVKARRANVEGGDESSVCRMIEY